PGAKFLSFFMFVLAYNGFETFSWSAHLDNYIIFFDLFPFVTIYALGPSLYLYIQSLLYPEKRLNLRKTLIHYAPLLFQFAFRISIIGVYLLVKNQLFFSKAQLEWLNSLFYLYAERLSALIFIIYLYLSFKVFIKASVTHHITSFSKEIQQEVHKWVKVLLICATVLAIAWPTTLLLPHVIRITHDAHYYPLEIALVIFIYWIVLVGYLKTKMIFRKTSKISQSSIQNTEVDQIIMQLRYTMENDKLYLEPTLNLQKLAKHTGLNAKTISKTLNQHIHQNFNDFINEYRVKEVCEKLVSFDTQHLTISGIALDSGFNSQATFQRAFKNITGMSPREYAVSQLKKTLPYK
ncbi:MAG: helix-turn-helix domain-containing protein, partial [Bacteroidota bacterium]